jgi:ribose transport system permease protein
MTALVLRYPAAVMLAVVGAVFGSLSPRFLDPANLVNIVVQCASVGIVATGMTFVLLTAGIDLSVGAVMFVSAAVAGKMAISGQPLVLVLAAVLAVGALYGAVNAIFVTRAGVKAFVVTLATLYVGRGLGLWITQTRALNLPESLLQVGSARLLGVPAPVVVLAIALVLGQLVLTRTPFGRHVYAVGHDAAAARRAGVPVGRVLFAVYVASGALAALGGAVAIAQLGAVSPTFGREREFAAVAAAVLGGVSLFGGRGGVLPGVLLGAVLIQTVENGLVIVNADPYLYPIILAAVIFLAVLLDGVRARTSRVR